MEWAWDVLRFVGLALLMFGGWSVTDSLARIARAMELSKAKPDG